MLARLSLALGCLAALATSACGGDDRLTDAGARPDAGFFIPRDSGPRDARGPEGPIMADTVVFEDASPIADDAAEPDAMPEDSGAAEAEAGVPDATPPAPDASPADAGTFAPDAMAPADATPAPDATMIADAGMIGRDAVAGGPDAAADAGTRDAATTPDAGPSTPDGGTIAQGGGLVITEFLARAATEWIEIHNTTAQPVNLANYTITIRSRQALGPLVLRATTDPTGAAGTAITIPAGGMLVGTANGAPIPGVARFLIGTPNQLGADWLADTGDVVTLRSPGGAGDVVDFTAAATNPANPIGPNDFPVLPDVSTQLDVAVVGGGGELGNDNGAVWCAPIFRGGTPNAANRSCGELVISELTYDYATPASGGDDGYEFIEIAGHAGGTLANVSIGFVEGTGAMAGGSNGPSIALTAPRVPLDGLYVVADRAPMALTSFVANADQIEEIGSGTSSSLENGPDAIQLFRQAPGGMAVLLDALAYGAITATQDTTRGLPVVETTPVADFATTAYPINYARSDDETDTNNNLADFSYAPTATPGVRNGTSALTITSISPDDAIAGTTATVTITGTNFTDGMTVTFTQAPAPTITNSAVVTPNQLTVRVTYPAAGSGMAERVNVNVAARPESGRMATAVGGFTWTTANNETGVATECDFCNLQFPLTLTLAPGATSALVFGRIYEAGRTDTTTGGPAPNILAELGFGPSGTDPRTRNWTWIPAVFNVESGNNDEYRATLTAPQTPGTYAYAYRFSLDGGLTWSYADSDGAGSNAGLTFTPATTGVLLVQ